MLNKQAANKMRTFTAKQIANFNAVVLAQQCKVFEEAHVEQCGDTALMVAETEQGLLFSDDTGVVYTNGDATSGDVFMDEMLYGYYSMQDGVLELHTSEEGVDDTLLFSCDCDKWCELALHVFNSIK